MSPVQLLILQRLLRIQILKILVFLIANQQPTTALFITRHTVLIRKSNNIMQTISSLEKSGQYQYTDLHKFIWITILLCQKIKVKLSRKKVPIKKYLNTEKLNQIDLKSKLQIKVKNRFEMLTVKCRCTKMLLRSVPSFNNQFTADRQNNVMLML